jgi:hypothetical protein
MHLKEPYFLILLTFIFCSFYSVYQSQVGKSYVNILDMAGKVNKICQLRLEMAAHSDIQSDGQTEFAFTSIYSTFLCQKVSAKLFLLLVIRL